MISLIKFIDTNVFIKRWTDTTVEGFFNNLEPENYCTSVLVLIEVHHKLEKKRVKSAFQFIRSIMGVVKVFDVTQDDLFNAIKNPLDVHINDKIHIAVMKRNNIQTIVSYDTDFDKEKGIRREEV